MSSLFSLSPLAGDPTQFCIYGDQVLILFLKDLLFWGWCDVEGLWHQHPIWVLF